MTDTWKDAAERIRNWGRWGDADQLGTLNHLTPAIVANAASLVRSGKAFSLSIPINGDGPLGAHGFRRNPIHIMSVDGGDEGIAELLKARVVVSAEAETRGLYEVGPFRFNDDWIMMPLQASTQWDALCHGYYDRQLYNGFPASSVTSFGAARDGIDAVAKEGRIAGRGVLLDVARHNNLDRLDAGYVITPEELDAVADAQGVSITDGDIVIVRTGWLTAFGELDGDSWQAQSPGVSWRVAEWLWERNCAAIASDNIAVEVMTPETDVILPFHMLALRDMGLMLGEIWSLEALAADCGDDGQYEFLLAAPPLNVTGGAGSPVNPIALK